MSELAVESAPDVAAAAHDAARGQLVYITERGNRVAGIVPVELAAILDRLTTDEAQRAGCRRRTGRADQRGRAGRGSGRSGSRAGVTRRSGRRRSGSSLA